MIRTSEFDSIRKLYLSQENQNSIESLRLHIDTLTDIVFALLMEVEALRSAQIDASKSSNEPLGKSTYAQAYRKTALLSHNGAGPTLGPDKVVLSFFGAETTGVADEASYRECVMLRRLGYSDDEILDYLRDVDHVAQLS